MLQPGKLDLRADRYVPFVRTLAFLDLDLTNAPIFKMEIRSYNGAPGAALITLSTVGTPDLQGVCIVYRASDTVQNHILAGRLRGVPAGYDLSTPVFLSQVSVRIDKANVVALPSYVESDDDVELAYDLHITPSGGDEDRYLYGAVILQSGSTL